MSTASIDEEGYANRVRKIAMLAFTACAACSLLVDTDDLDKPTGGASDGGPESAAIIPAEASISIPNEAGTDGSSDAAPPRFCASHANAILCDDFDQPNRTDLRTEGWTPNFAPYPMGAPTTAQFFSPPQSARIVWDWPDAGVASREGASRTVGVPASLSAVTISLRVRPELTLAADEQIVAVSLRSCVVFASSNSADMLWQDNRESIGGFNVSFEKWTLITFTIKVRKDGCDTTVAVGEGASAIVLPTKTMNLTPTGDLPSIAAIDLGYTGHDTVGAVSFDDVLFVAAP
jgi:hypothetical protein